MNPQLVSGQIPSMERQQDNKQVNQRDIRRRLRVRDAPDGTRNEHEST
jgi:hypothetical protein